MLNYTKFALAGLTLLLFSCGNSSSGLRISFSADSSTIICSGIEAAAQRAVREELAAGRGGETFFSVLETPGDSDTAGREVEWPGKLELYEQDLVFRPDTPFRKGKTYLVETMIGAHFASKADVLRSDVGHRVKMKQEILKR